MSVDVNWLAVLLAAVSSMVVGMIWYSKSLFGNEWRAFAHLTDEKMRKGAPMALATAFVSALIMAYVLAHVTFLANNYFNNSFLQDAVSTAFWVWLGFQGVRVVMRDTFEMRRKKWTLITLGNDFVTIMIMGIIIGLLHP